MNDIVTELNNQIAIVATKVANAIQSIDKKNIDCN